MYDFKTIKEFIKWYQENEETGFCFAKQNMTDRHYMLYSTGWLAGQSNAPQQPDSADENSALCLCPLHFGDCEHCENGRCNSPLI